MSKEYDDYDNDLCCNLEHLNVFELHQNLYCKAPKNYLPKKQNTHIIRLASIIFYTRESPSGKASAFQADIRGFESHLPLFKKCFSVTFQVSAT